MIGPPRRRNLLTLCTDAQASKPNTCSKVRCQWRPIRTLEAAFVIASETTPRQIPSAACRICTLDRPRVSAASDRPICYCQLVPCSQRPLSGRPKCLTAYLDQSQQNFEGSGCTRQRSASEGRS